MSPSERLTRDAALLGVTLAPDDAARLLRLLDELERWNRSYNLTAIGDREEMITHHLLDSLSIHPDLAGTRIADVGTGAGFPGLPLAIVNPSRHFTLIDSSGKKARFVAHAARTLSLDNVSAVHSRAESLNPPVPFDTVTARALAPLPELLAQVAPLCGPATRVLAMKGRWPEEELKKLPPPWRLAGSRTLTIPGLEAERCVLIFGLKAPAALSAGPPAG
ncbi:MAG TPA: 16S rRNA (guanine(527)-N(7))-methyltransferase RsmG [Steroidobacteraceae bacterium]|nr:16S rRNA (guanine(527)-N(7))-methyltransferase RsmG [Steroidobacteraceae bacterium]